MPVKIVEDDLGYFTDMFGNINSIRQFTLSNDKLIMQVINYGATISCIKIPDLNCKVDDIVLGYNDVSYYLNDNYYFGSTIGRFANRIAKGKFSLDGKDYCLAVNNGVNHLHGGNKGFNKVLWNYASDNNKVIFSYTSPSMEENYPGELKCSVTYELSESSEVVIKFHAIASEKTPINLTNHSYFNLGGHDSGSVQDHLISINADYYIPVDENMIPTGEIAAVTGTPFDVRKPVTISSILSKIPEGVDHTFCINGSQGSERKVARVEDPKSKRVMEIFSSQPGVQFYTANFLPENDTLLGKHGNYYKKHGAFCLETQNYPNAINQSNFPKAFIDVGEEYKHTTRLRFTTM